MFNRAPKYFKSPNQRRAGGVDNFDGNDVKIKIKFDAVTCGGFDEVAQEGIEELKS